MTYQETLEYLYNSLPVFQRIGAAAYKSNLDNTITLDNHLEHPHHHFKSIHIAGTNGKGSVSQMVYEVLRAAGYSVGLYTSPHLSDFRERIIVDGEMIPQEYVIRFVEQNREIIEKIQPSFFEVTVAMAFDHFRTQNVDYAIIEVGMGGRLDSTNIISPILSIITNIDYDHTQFLGTTLQEIAAEKAGIIKEYTPVVIGQTNPETAPVFIRKARQQYAPIHFADQRYRCQSHTDNRFTVESLIQNYTFDLDLAMSGDYQMYNICTALTAMDILSEQIPITRENVKQGMAASKIRGRWQKLATEPLTICDTGHNKAGIKLVTEQIARQNYTKLYMVIGVVADKDIDAILTMLPKQAHYIFTQANIPRAMNAQILARRAQEFGLNGEIISTVPQAFEQARALASKDDMIFIGGSTFVVAEIV